MSDQLPTILSIPPYDPAEIILIGSNIAGSGSKTVAEVKIESGGSPDSRLTIQLMDTGADQQIALIRAYVYEGNYYELPKPKIMVVTGDATDIPGDYVPKNRKLQFWRMNKLNRTTEISVEDGLLETLVLEANMPGRRSPNSYAANMQMAHKSGRLTS
ncbi:hypothetical protein K1718_00690 [Roseibium porphyridii]|uniref:Uncharacterized protein n=1 Tax=Roseibium porphyridii TaxID=2866279 RepID=A0ABY8F336_9HYPH|nr:MULTISPECIES: hypothetical protein [Stappiaceae]QFT28894.1 hypothetical protein FIV00_00195 [Labrenzia sp. THAF82]WFE89903.1 hypothetical protein K1718_00690 [Roseibium sp. KMA01]